SIESCARLRRSSTLQWSAATPTIGQFSRDLSSSRYRAWNVITLARSPVIPKITNTSASCFAVSTRLPPRMSVPSVHQWFRRVSGVWPKTRGSRLGQASAQDVVGPGLVGQDDRKEDRDDDG